jgi:hypothetical protein
VDINPSFVLQHPQRRVELERIKTNKSSLFGK